MFPRATLWLPMAWLTPSQVLGARYKNLFIPFAPTGLP